MSRPTVPLTGLAGLCVFLAAIAGPLSDDAHAGVPPDAPGERIEPASSRNSAVYLEMLGRSSFFVSLHLELVEDGGWGLETGIGWIPAELELVFLDAGALYRLWTGGGFGLVAAVSVCYHSETAHWNNSGGSSQVWGLAGGAYLEFRDSILVRLGLMPQVLLGPDDSGFMAYNLRPSKWWYYLQFVTMHFGWTF